MPMTINSTQMKPLVLEPGAGAKLAGAGVNIALKVAGAQSDGQLLVLEYSAPVRFAGPPPHWHKITTEIFYVLEGALSLQIGGETTLAGPGGCAFVPPGAVHAFANPGDAPARFLLIASPAGLEGYFAELSELIRHEPAWPPRDMTALRELMARYDTFAPPVEP